MSPGEYLYFKLFADQRCSVSMASGTGLLDQNAADWDDETLSALPITRENLNPLSDIDSPLRGLREPWRSRWPALTDVPWVPAIGDGAASNLGSGCDSDRRVAINLGTSGAIRVLFAAERVEIPPDLWCYRLDRRRFVMGGAFSDGGSVYAWMRETLNLSGSDDELEERLANREPFGHGITFLPFLSGERSTGWRPDATATLHGVRASTSPLDILQASLEGVALRFALVAASLRRVFPQANEIRGSGGALGQSPLWAQMICDAIGQPIHVTAETEASSRGAALTALAAAGYPMDDAHTPVETGREFTPDPRRHQRYQEALAAQQDLYRRLAGPARP
jgi:gluconokinase